MEKTVEVLLVEDEVHKRAELTDCIVNIFGSPPDHVDSVRSAVLQVIQKDYDLIVLDMALPTFSSNSSDQHKGHDQAQGGIEVLRALKSNKKEAKIIIVTQYHDFYIGGSKIKLKDSPKIINEKYNQNVVGAILYKYKSTSTLQKITAILRGMK